MKIQLIILILICLTSCSSNNAFEDEHEESVRYVVTNWILNNSDFPKYYEPISFESYENDILDSGFYKIVHSYYLKSNDNKLVKNKHEFVLTKNYKVAIVSLNPTFIGETFNIRGIPPSVFDWSKKFGEKFIDVDYNGHNTDWFLKKYSDYKTIKAHKHCSFDYIRTDCQKFLIKSIESYFDKEFQIERIFSVLANNREDSEYNRLVDGNGINEDNLSRTTFFVIKVKSRPKEIYTFAQYFKESNKIVLTEIKFKSIYSCELDTLYTTTNCFYNDLKWE